jgi:hypothetical protein
VRWAGWVRNSSRTVDGVGSLVRSKVLREFRAHLRWSRRSEEVRAPSSDRSRLQEWARGRRDRTRVIGRGRRGGRQRDEGERRLTGGTDQGEDFIDPSEKSGPPGGPGGGGIGCVPFYPLWLESRGRGFCRERKRGTGSLGGQGVILPGPFGDEGSQGRIGGKDPVVSVAMDAGWGKDRGQAIQDTERSGVRRRGGVGWAVRGGNSRAQRRRAVRPAGSGLGRM